MNPFLPTVQIIPEGQLIYSPNKLELLGEFTRTSFRQNYGQAPPFDPARQPKTWRDDSVAGQTGKVTYNVLISPPGPMGVANPHYENLEMGAAVASSINLPGAYEWPVWEPAPTLAVIYSVQNSALVTPIGSHTLSTEEQARSLAAELGANRVDTVNSVGSAFRYDYRGETRRVHALSWQDNRRMPLVAGLLLSIKYQGGVGRLGSWKDPVDFDAYPEWVPNVTDDGAGRTDFVPVPSRPLREGEKVVRNMFGVQIHYTPSGAPPSDTELLLDIRAKLQKILTAFSL